MMRITPYKPDAETIQREWMGDNPPPRPTFPSVHLAQTRSTTFYAACAFAFSFVVVAAFMIVL